MQTKYAFLADAAQAAGGKLSVLGVGIDRVNPPQLPITLPVSVIVGLGYSKAEVGRKQITVRLLDADGRDVISPVGVETDFTAPETGTRGQMNIIVNLQVPLAEPGDYAVYVTIDGNDVAELSLRVSEPSTSS